MTRRSVAMVIILSCVTFGIYNLVWMVKTKNEMNARGASIPTAWLLLLGPVALYWLWKYSEGVAQVTGGKTSAVTAFVMLWILGPIGSGLLQGAFNSVAELPAGGAGMARAA